MALLTNSDGSVNEVAVNPADMIVNIGEVPVFIIQSVEVRQSYGEFAKVILEMISTSQFGVGELPKIDFSKIFKAPEVAKAITDECERQVRKFNFEE